MDAIELEKAYDPETFEARIYARWKEAGAFRPESAKGGGKPFSMVIPPPNVTGRLHLGHGLNNSLQDVIVRFHRMRGNPVLWLPGTDHAGIATQHVVERRLKAEGRSRVELGREKFVEEAWKTTREHHAVICEQLARIGAGVDWDRERFTFDEGLARAVREVFVTLYERDLMYKGNYLVNWCSSCGTALADDEVNHEEVKGKLYRLRYYFAGPEGEAARQAVIRGEQPPAGTFIEIDTSRPETLFGDTAVAANPEDPRYVEFKGKTVILPIVGKEIPVVLDSFVDRDFGTGVLKITPAHAVGDWEVAGRQSLPVLNILNADGTLNDEVPPQYRGLSVNRARQEVAGELKAGGWYVQEQDIRHAVGHCYRCETVIEPFLSEQWFVRMKPLAEKALAAWQKGEIVFHPKRWENTYRHWMENIRDWCVSRQLWWGHRIPAWTCKACGKLSVSRTDLSACPHCGSAELARDPDVLDTWFSSWLWPFSTLGWENPDCDTQDFRTYYPTDAIVTGYDIIFFWIARMVMAGLEFTGRVPFRDIYIHGLLRDKQGRKMSKSLGNGLDPLELVEEFGADAMKFTLAFLCAQGQDLLVDKDSFKMGSKFVNKVWNASRYILMNLRDRNPVENPALLPVDRWIYSRLNEAARAMEEAFLSYRFNDAASCAYEYFWGDFCDWYLEATKLSVRSGENGNADEKDRAATVLLDILAGSLRLLHPLLPFVTEEIYGKLPNVGKDELLITAAYPKFDPAKCDIKEEKNFAFLKELVRQVRTLKGECNIATDRKLKVLARPEAGFRPVLEENAELVKLLAGIGELEIDAGDAEGRPEGAVGLAGGGFAAFVFVADAVDTAALKRKFAKDLQRDSAFVATLRAKLANEKFLENAPAELVAGEKAKLEDALVRIGRLESYVREL